MKRTKSISERAKEYATNPESYRGGVTFGEFGARAWEAGYRAGIKREPEEVLRLRLALYLRSHDARRLADVPESQIPTVEVPQLREVRVPRLQMTEAEEILSAGELKDFIPRREERSGGTLRNAEFPEGTIVVEDATGTHAILPNGRDLLNDTGNLRILR